MKILIVGGTRFVGKAIVKELLIEGHDIFLFTRGNNPIPEGVVHIKGDRNREEDLKQLSANPYDVIIDSSGRKLIDTQLIIKYTGKPKYRFIYISSAGVYSRPYILPVNENCELDPLSRHSGKSDTELWLKNECIPFTSFRPTYIYGPGNYNPIEKWFFDRITNNRIIPIPGDGETITQLVHVLDLARAIKMSLNNSISQDKIYNCSGNEAITFNGLVKETISIAGKESNHIKTKYFDIGKLDLKSRKFFPLRSEHFFTDSSLIENELGWRPKYSIHEGLLDSYQNDYLLKSDQTLDFSQDDILLGS